MGVHAGEAEIGEFGYVGVDVHLAARVAQAARGGQVLVSETAVRMGREAQRQGASFEDLGAFRLEGLSSSTRLFELVDGNGSSPPWELPAGS